MTESSRGMVFGSIGLVIMLTGAGWGVLLLEYGFDKMIATIVSISVILIGFSMLYYFLMRIPEQEISN